MHYNLIVLQLTAFVGLLDFMDLVIGTAAQNLNQCSFISAKAFDSLTNLTSKEIGCRLTQGDKDILKVATQLALYI